MPGCNADGHKDQALAGHGTPENWSSSAPIDIFFRSLYCQKKDAIQSVPARYRSYLLNRRYSIDE